MGQFHDERFPGESDAYRAARDELLEAEDALRAQIERVAAMRRALPPGGALKQDYVFDEGAETLEDIDTVRQTRFSDLFAPGKESLVIYSFMYAPGGDPCQMCVSFLDSLNGAAPHIGDRVNLAVVAKAPIGTIRGLAQARGWNGLRLLSSGGNNYNTDYIAERDGNSQIPAMNVFRRTDAGIHHAYNAELLYGTAAAGQHNRHVDMLWPLWNVLDLTPDGRGTDWWPQLSYD